MTIVISAGITIAAGMKLEVAAASSLIGDTVLICKDCHTIQILLSMSI